MDGRPTVPAPEGYENWGKYCAKNKDDPFCAENVRSHYEAIPSIAPNAIFAAIFGLSLIGFLATYFATRRRGTFFMVVMVLGNLTEVLGYVGRLLSNGNPWEDLGFLMQIVCLTIAPAFLAAGVYSCLAIVVLVYGESNSRLKAAWYTRIFIPCDFVSLVLQAAGGALASSAEDDVDMLNMGNNIMIAGLAFQVFTLLLFIVCAADFGLRVMRRKKQLGAQAFDQNDIVSAVRGSRMFKLLLLALSVSTLTIFWRSVFRVAELSEGWNGPLMAREDLFIAFEGVMISVSVIVLNVFHPAVGFGAVMDKDYLKVLKREEGVEKGSPEDSSS